MNYNDFKEWLLLGTQFPNTKYFTTGRLLFCGQNSHSRQKVIYYLHKIFYSLWWLRNYVFFVNNDKGLLKILCKNYFRFLKNEVGYVHNRRLYYLEIRGCYTIFKKGYTVHVFLNLHRSLQSCLIQINLGNLDNSAMRQGLNNSGVLSSKNLQKKKFKKVSVFKIENSEYYGTVDTFFKLEDF